MGRKYLIARLRPNKDNDLIEATENIETGRLSDIIRDGVRYILFGGIFSSGRVNRINGQIKKVQVDESTLDLRLDETLSQFSSGR